MQAQSNQNLDSLLPYRGILMSLPRPNGLDSFLRFIETELAPQKINLLILQVDYHYQFASHPELVDSFALSQLQVGRIVQTCRSHNIRLIPEMDLLGHQSWASRLNKLLSIYPEFDETPWIRMPEKYEWPNADSLYCKSYCPLHPDLHPILFDLIDEICDAFSSDAFHGGMDEVFFIGEEKCPRCGGRNKAELFAGELRLIRDHLAQKKREFWIWGDRLIDGRTAGLGIWEASYNNTWPAIDLIPQDLVICDWHYERADKTAVYFAMKGFRVLTSGWRLPEVTNQQVQDMVSFRRQSSPEMRERFLGFLQTTWSRNNVFLKEYYSAGEGSDSLQPGAAHSFRTLIGAINKL